MESGLDAAAADDAIRRNVARQAAVPVRDSGRPPHGPY
jgi:hypothetical protein